MVHPLEITIMNRLKLLQFGSVAVGAMDALTGLLLIVVPGLVLRLLGIDPVAEESLVFLRWIGVFVMSVGLSYGLCLRGRAAAETVWAFTGTARFLVCVFLLGQVVTHHLEPAWLLVAVSDGAVAIVQFIGLRAAWWKGGGT